MNKTTAFRVDSSIDIGTGHVMRCLAIADELKLKSINSLFICRDLPGNIHNIIISRGYQVLLLPLSTPYRPIKNDSDYQGWLQVSQLEDANEFILHLKKEKYSDGLIIIVDHYALDTAWEFKIKTMFDSLLIAIDDIVRPHFADIVIDQTLDRKETAYKKTPTTSKILCGSEYALIRSSFYVNRERKLEKKDNKKNNLLITLGGFDKKNIISKIIDTITSSNINWINKTTILLNKNNGNYKSIKSKIKKNILNIELISFIEDMPKFMMDYDISIGSPGSSTWERAALGIPAILIPIAENQNDIARIYQQYNAGVVINPDDIDSTLLPVLDKLKQNYDEFKKINYQITDGLGIRRVIQHIFPYIAKDGAHVTLRKATINDIDLVYLWQCQQSTRQYARNPSIPTYPEHKKWMQDKLTNPVCYFYIIQHNHEPAGVIRLDKKSYLCYEVSIFLDKNRQMMGIAKNALNILSDIHTEVNISATVFVENKASQALFTSLNYVKIKDNEFRLERHFREEIS